uniref:N-domain of Clp chaperone n=1 Tax=Neustupella aerophytica TaxID=2962111 RepID=UPI0021822847|nr:N-domain of Clp chaperone [Neustupella aerophytica]UVI61098.1 N-domain of Clp chaperone [Neustupella aerophytica]
MLVKKMVMSKKIQILNKRLLSLQLKKAIFYAFLEAKKHGSIIIDSEFLLYGILKVNNSLANKLFKQIYKARSSFFNPTDNLVSKLNSNFQTRKKTIYFSTQGVYPNFSRPVKQLLFFLLRYGENPHTKVITSLHVLKYLLRQKNICTLVKNALGTY